MANSNQPQQQETDTLIGVISDTHGLLRPEAMQALAGSQLILHAGDIGNPEVLHQLQAIAPTFAVRGNNDQGTWTEQIPEFQTIQSGNITLYVLHILKTMAFDPAEQQIRVVISGHSHKPLIQERAGVLFLNPGSAGPRRFKLPISVAQLRLNGSAVQAEIIELAV